MLNLEMIEQKSLKFLMEASNPLVRVSTLFNHLNDDEDCRGITMSDLLDFLSHHELFRVMEPGMDGEDEQTLPDSIDLGPRVILVTRIPTPQEMANMITAQMKVMTEALERAQAGAARVGDESNLNAIKELMSRAERLTKQLEEEIGEEQ
jgi:hypothetical protein